MAAPLLRSAAVFPPAPTRQPDHNLAGLLSRDNNRSKLQQDPSIDAIRVLKTINNQGAIIPLSSRKQPASKDQIILETAEGNVVSLVKTPNGLSLKSIKTPIGIETKFNQDDKNPVLKLNATDRRILDDKIQKAEPMFPFKYRMPESFKLPPGFPSHNLTALNGKDPGKLLSPESTAIRILQTGGHDCKMVEDALNKGVTSVFKIKSELGRIDDPKMQDKVLGNLNPIASITREGSTRSNINLPQPAQPYQPKPLGPSMS